MTTKAIVREAAEQREFQILAPFAAKSREAERAAEEAPCPFRTAFQRDRDRIIHCKAFRRLAYKTQVFINPAGDHYRTRLTHTLEVGQISRTLAHALGLNEDLTEAIAMGHDLGHTPFGHSGERVLNKLRPGGFKHQEQSLRVVDYLEKEGQGLNLTREVRDGILKHSKGGGPIFAPEGCAPATLEGQLVRVSDIIAYLAHDLDDALRSGLLIQDDVPLTFRETFGHRGSTRIGAMVDDLLTNSQIEDDKLTLAFSPAMEQNMNDLREFLYQNVYRHPKLDRSMEKADKILINLFEEFLRDKTLLTRYYPAAASRPSPQAEWDVCDFIAGMTDRYALQVHQDLFLPQCWPVEN
ncbi:deoxyguanosinetriphosphate triphosphohydrolase [Deltaproteobacteria bacterium Smac51]|nr:deoxyguanosinetriphosphate triphosphohydrolase [Deltaproteobacteria bacterium Smac51]